MLQAEEKGYSYKASFTNLLQPKSNYICTDVSHFVFKAKNKNT